MKPPPRHTRERRLSTREDDAHQVGGVASSEFFHDAGAVDFDGAGRDAELATGFLVGLAIGDELQHLAFARGELGEAAHLDRAAARLDRSDVDVLP